MHTTLEQKTLGLIDYFSNRLKVKEKSVPLSSEEKKWLADLRTSKKSIQEFVAGRQRDLRMVQEQNDADLAFRRTANCEHCEDDDIKELFGSGLFEETGYTHDTLKCHSCGTLFVCPIPNNDKDRVSYFEKEINKITSVLKKDGMGISEEYDGCDSDELELLLVEYEEIIVSIKASIESEEDYHLQLAETLKEIRKLHDHLTKEKVNSLGDQDKI